MRNMSCGVSTLFTVGVRLHQLESSGLTCLPFTNKIQLEVQIHQHDILYHTEPFLCEI